MAIDLSEVNPQIDLSLGLRANALIQAGNRDFLSAIETAIQIPNPLLYGDTIRNISAIFANSTPDLAGEYLIRVQSALENLIL